MMRTEPLTFPDEIQTPDDKKKYLIDCLGKKDVDVNVDSIETHLRVLGIFDALTELTELMERVRKLEELDN